MSANPQQMPLAQAEVMETRIPTVAAPVKRAARVTAEIIIGLVATMLGAEDRNLETWARTERVSWYRGCGR